MSQRSVLQAAPRTASTTTALKRLRKQGLVPAIVYGKGFENRNVEVNAKAFRDLLSHSTSENVLVELETTGAGNQLVLIQDVQHNAITGGFVHVDFHAVRENEIIHAHVPLEFIGEPVGVKVGGGLLQHTVHSLDIGCLPKDLPERITVDVSALDLGQALHVREIQFPEGVTTRLGKDVVVALVAEPKVSAEAEAAAAAAIEAKKDAKKGGDKKGGGKK